MELIFIYMLLLTVPVGMYFYIVWKIRGKTLCYFLEPNKGVTPVLLPCDEDFVYDYSRGDAYYIYPEKIRLTDYPSMMPKFLRQNVPSVLYERGNGEPLDWIELSKRTISAKEIGSAMEPKWIQSIVQGARESAPESGFKKFVPVLSLVVGGLALVMIFVLFTKMGGIEAGQQALTQSLKLFKP